jgi:tetratricopeptide (TPR) repeat protein
MKHLGLYFAFIGGIMLLYMLPKLISHEFGIDTAAPGESQARLERLEQSIRDDAANRKALATTFESLVLRIESLEGRLDRQPLDSQVDSPQPTGNDPTPLATDAHSPRGKRVSPAEFKTLMSKVLRSTLDGTATAEEQERFWQATRTTGLVDDTITNLESYMEAHPQDNEARMELGDAYVAKLLTVPGGPERGIWGMKAQKQWENVVKQDPDHWDAQYTLAFNYSMYPDFLNKTDDAIAGFERALEIQGRAQPKPQHAKTYVQLARMHNKKGNTEKAREVLELGRMRHPQDKQITAALQGLPDK